MTFNKKEFLEHISEYVETYTYEKSGEVKSYSPDRKRQIQGFFNQFVDSIQPEDFENTEKVMTYMRGRYPNEATLNKNLGFLSAYIKKTKGQSPYSSVIAEIANKEKEKKREDIEPIEIEKIDEIKDINDKLLLSLYAKIPPLRSDYNSIKIRNFDTETDNYYNDGKLIFNTLVKNDGKMEKDVSILRELIEACIDANKSSDYLFHMENGEPYENRYFCKYISRVSKRYLGRNLGIMDYRTLYSSTFCKDTPQNQIHSKATELASEMNNSATTQKQYYIRDIAGIDKECQTEDSLIEVEINGLTVFINKMNLQKFLENKKN